MITPTTSSPLGERFDADDARVKLLEHQVDAAHTPMSPQFIQAIGESLSVRQRGFTHGTDSTEHDRPGDIDRQQC